MSKPNTKKMLTVMITVVMVFSALAILSFAATPAFAQSASGQFYATVDPTNATALAPSSGGEIITPLATPGPMIFIGDKTESLTAGQVVDFYWSTTSAVSGIVGGSVGTATASSSGKLYGAFVLTSAPSAGTYYLLAASEGDTSGGVAASFGTFTVVTQTSYPASLQLSLNDASFSSNVTGSPNTGSSGTEIFYEGSGFTSTTTVTLQAFSSTGVALSTAFTFSSDAVSSGVVTGHFYVTPNPKGYYYVIAYDSGTGGSLGTGQSVLTITPDVTPVFSVPISVTSFSTITITGYGFVASDTFAASTSASPTNSVTIAGVDAIIGSSTVTASTAGTVTFSVTGLASSLASTGPVSVVVTDRSGNTYTFADQAYVSSPTGVPSLVVYDGTYGTTSGYVGDTLTVVLYNFPASQTPAANLDGQAFGSFSPSSTDSNGFSTGTLTLNNIPGGTYTVYGSAQNYYASANFTVLPLATYEDSSSTSISGEYAVSTNSHVTASIAISVTGLKAYTEYTITDTGIASLGVSSNLAYNYHLGLITISSGSGSVSSDHMGFTSSNTGTISVTYDLKYTGLATGTNETISVGTGVNSAYYYTVGEESISGLSASYAPTTGTHTTVVSFTVSNLVPSGAYYTPQTTDATYGVTGAYTVEVTSTAISSLSTGKSSFTVSSLGSVSVSFNLPNTISAGLNQLKVLSKAGQTVAENYEFLVSSPGTSTAVTLNTDLSGTGSSTYQAEPLVYDLTGFPANTAVTVVYYSNTGQQTATLTTDSNGAYSYAFTVPSGTAGTYSIAFKYGTSSSVTTTYTIQATLAYDQAPFNDNSNSPATDFNSYFTVYSNVNVYAYPNENVTFYAYGLTPNTVYNVYLSSSDSSFTGTSPSSSEYLTSFTTDQFGDGPSAGIVVQLLSNSAGTYYLDAAVSGSSSVSQYLTVEMNGYDAIFSGLNYTAANVPAFPGQIVTFSWTPSTAPATPGSATTKVYGQDVAGSIYVTINLNGTAYTTVPVSDSSGTLTGAFLAPNSNAGNYWSITLTWAQTVYENVLSGGTPTGQSTILNSYTDSSSSLPTLTIVQGSGALLISVSTTGIASIITSTVDSALSVPLSELSANITALHGQIVTIDTAFGTMTTTLSTINATVSAIESGQALLTTDVGSISTSLASLNASLVAFNGNVVAINTTLGLQSATLGSINGTVHSNANGISSLQGSAATITTDLGTFSGTVTSVSGGIATIQTALGTLQTNVSAIKTSTGTITSQSSSNEIFLIVIIVLVLITLVLAFLAISGVNRVSKKLEEQKKQ